MHSRAAAILAISLLLAFGSAIRAQESASPLANQPARHSPAWLESGVIYEVFTREFSPEGNFNGVTKRLDDLKSLGVNILWLMPIHPVGKLKSKGTLGSPYAVRDYYAIDPKLGTPEDLHRLVEQAHKRQMKVIIDMVANHTAWDSVMMSHPDFYKHNAQGQIISPYDWTDVAALNYANPKLRRYMTDMLVHWIKDFDLDGFRCDAAAEVPTDFWEAARIELEHVKPDIMMLAEASKPELLHSAFDIDYAWPLMATLNDVVMHGEPATAVRNTIEEQRKLFPKGALHMRVSDDHDEFRGVERYGMTGALAASALMFTLDGVPVLYNGMEIGDTTESHGGALFEDLKIVWAMSDARPEFGKFYAAMIPLRKAHAALRQGELVWLHNSDEQHVVSYLRRTGDEQFLVAINLSNTPFRGTVEAESANWKEVDLPKPYPQQSAVPALALDAFECRIFLKQPR